MTGTVTEMVPPLVVNAADEADQELDAKVEPTSSAKPAAAALQEMIAWLPDRAMLKSGAPGVCTAAMMLQKPPVCD